MRTGILVKNEPPAGFFSSPAGAAAGAAAVRFPFPYEAAAWSVLAQRLRIVQAARLRAELITRHGQDGASPRRTPWPGSTWTFRAGK